MVIKEQLETRIVKECEVLVAGGGFAGIAAALAAARAGKKVVLLEREYILGGLGTAGLVSIYLPICDGMGRQVCFGIAEELLRLSISMGAEDLYPDNWLLSDDPSKRTEKDKRFRVRYNPNLCAILMEKQLLSAGVEILYGTYAVGADVKGGKIHAVIIENKSGRGAIKADSVVDATGDCDIAAFAGAKTERFTRGNDLAAWYYYLDQNEYNLTMLGMVELSDEEKTAEKTDKRFTECRFLGLDGEELSKRTQLSHAAILHDVMERRKADPAVVPTSIASIPQMRMTRKIVGEYALDAQEEHTYFEDSIGLIPDWRKRGPVYEVPFRTLYTSSIKNLITAGRCISVTDDMWAISRVIPCCAVTGEAAGLAAALSDDFSALSVKDLQKALLKNGVVLHEKELKQ